MKAKSKKIVIIVVAAVLVVALAGTGIFFALKNGGEAVKVTPVSNVSGGFGGGNNEISDYGNVTTNMNQDIYCDDTLTITQVFVQEGDAVKTGDPLIAYDTTLLSLELEMKQMEIDGLGLQMQSIQQEINQLRGMNPATTGRAALDSAGLFYNVSSSGGEFRHESLVAGRTCASNANVGNENGLMNLSAAGQPENSDSSGAGVTSPDYRGRGKANQVARKRQGKARTRRADRIRQEKAGTRRADRARWEKVKTRRAGRILRERTGRMVRTRRKGIRIPRAGTKSRPGRRLEHRFRKNCAARKSTR